MKRALSLQRRESFCLAYMTGMGGSRAALAAGYAQRNPKNAHVMAWFLMKQPAVQERLKELQQQASDDAILTLIQCKIVLSEIGRARLSDYQDENGHLRPLDKNSPNPSAIASVEYAYDPVKREPYPTKIRLHDAIDAIVELCKLDGHYQGKKVKVSLPAITNVTLDQARAKLDAAVAEAHEASGKASP